MHQKWLGGGTGPSEMAHGRLGSARNGLRHLSSTGNVPGFPLEHQKWLRGASLAPEPTWECNRSLGNDLGVPQSTRIGSRSPQEHGNNTGRVWAPKTALGHLRNAQNCPLVPQERLTWLRAPLECPKRSRSLPLEHPKRPWGTSGALKTAWGHF